jgi:hypothetical protein
MDGDLADVVRVGQAGVAPRRAAVVQRKTPSGHREVAGLLEVDLEPSQRTFGSDGARAMCRCRAPTVLEDRLQVRPRLTVFQRFPGPKATYIVFGRAGSI